MEGFGKLIKADGDVYTGQWYNGLWKGIGEFRTKNGVIIRATWDNCKLNGPVETIMPTRQVMSRMYIDNEAERFGVIAWPSGQFYSGEWLNDVPHGFGEFLASNGDQYFGEWKEDKRHGKGRLITSAGVIRDRLWVDGIESSKECDVKDILHKAQQGVVTDIIILC